MPLNVSLIESTLMLIKAQPPLYSALQCGYMQSSVNLKKKGKTKMHIKTELLHK